MGLDMYLSASKYVGGWRHQAETEDGKAEMAAFDAIVKATGMTPCEQSPSFQIEATVGYWRKANAIHQWFVEQCQDGKDDCGRYSVTQEQLVELRDKCKAVLALEVVPGQVHDGTTYLPGGKVQKDFSPGIVLKEPDKAAEILPTRSGFFFGGTDYDEGYLDDLRNTIEIIDKVLSDPVLKDCDFYYHSSW